MASIGEKGFSKCFLRIPCDKSIHPKLRQHEDAAETEMEGQGDEDAPQKKPRKKSNGPVSKAYLEFIRVAKLQGVSFKEAQKLWVSSTIRAVLVTH